MMLKDVTPIKEILNRMDSGPEVSEIRLPPGTRPFIPVQEPIRAWRRPSVLRNDQRFYFIADVILLGPHKECLGRAMNISESGIFVGVDHLFFSSEECLELTIIPVRGRHSYKVFGEIARTQNFPRSQRGYGIKFK